MQKLLVKLEKLAIRTIKDCTFRIPSAYFGQKKRRPLLLPSGDRKYNSFWVRDCSMMAESGLVDTERLRLYIEIIALYGQNGGAERILKNNLRIPPYAVADHINYDGGAVFYPGTMSSNDNQGTGNFGYFPPFCDNFCFAILTDCYIRQSGDKDILFRKYNGMTLYDRLVMATKCYQIDEITQLCYSDDTFFTVDWGFTDSIRKTGFLLMSSLLRYRAVKILATYSDKKEAEYWEKIASTIHKNILSIFYDDKSGWMYSATGICKQHDVWATAYAGYIGLLKEDKTYEALKEGYEKHSAVIHGYVRQILTHENATPNSAWEGGHNGFSYQNGGYWSTATGWYAKTLSVKYPKLAEKMLKDFLAHTSKYRIMGSPYEWINENTTKFSGRRYGTSGVLPYTAFKDYNFKEK